MGFKGLIMKARTTAEAVFRHKRDVFPVPVPLFSGRHSAKELQMRYDDKPEANAVFYKQSVETPTDEKLCRFRGVRKDCPLRFSAPS